MSTEGENAAPAGQPMADGQASAPVMPAGNPLMGAQPPTAVSQPSDGTPAAGSQITGFDEAGQEDQAWIEKARAIIARSTGDPYVRHDVLNQLKYQYLKQRFGKDIGSKQD